MNQNIKHHSMKTSKLKIKDFFNFSINEDRLTIIKGGTGPIEIILPPIGGPGIITSGTTTSVSQQKPSNT
jgi:hypothetical protein